MARLALVDHLSTAPHLHWDVAELDAIFRDLPEFTNLQVVCVEPQRAELFWQLIERRVLPSACAGGLNCISCEVPADVRELSFLRDRCERDAVDVLFLRAEAGSAAAVAERFGALPPWTAAVILLTPHPVLAKSLKIEMTLTFEGNVMHLSNADGRTRRRGNLKLEVLERMSGAPEAAKPRLCALGVSKEIGASLANAFGHSYEIVSQIQEDGLPEAMLVAAPWTNAGTRELVRKFAAKVPVLYLQGAAVRIEDRVEIYRSGVKSILPPAVVVDEIVAALHALMPAGAEHSDPFRELDAEFTRMCEGARKQSFWSLDESEPAVQHYLPFVENRVCRAALAGHCAGAVIIPLPTLGAHAESGASALLERTLVGNTLAQLRTSDISFVMNRQIVIVSHQMSALSAQAIFKRYASLLRELQQKSPAPSPKIVRSCVPSSGKEREEARRFLHEIVRLTSVACH